MIAFLIKYKKWIYLSIAGVFVLTIFYGLGSYMVKENDSSAAVATVGTVKIPYQTFLRNYSRTIDSFKDKGMEQVPDVLAKQIKGRVLQEMVQEELMAQAAQDYGFAVSDAELSMIIQSNRAFQSEGRFDRRLYERALYEIMRVRPAEFEASLRRQLLANKFQTMVVSVVKLTPSDIEREYAARKGGMKDFAKEKDGFSSELINERAGALMNQYLREAQTRHAIVSLLDKREPQEKAG